MGWQSGAGKIRAIGLMASGNMSDDQIAGALDALEAASQELVTDLSRKMNAQLVKVPDPAARSWVKLFNKIDEDGSGKITYRRAPSSVAHGAHCG